MSSIKTPKVDLSKYPNWMNFDSCEVCPNLNDKMKSLKIRLQSSYDIYYEVKM